jgi:hypothetical protein
VGKNATIFDHYTQVAREMPHVEDDLILFIRQVNINQQNGWFSNL